MDSLGTKWRVAGMVFAKEIGIWHWALTYFLPMPNALCLNAFSDNIQRQLA
jgi:hypothetical protein